MREIKFRAWDNKEKQFVGEWDTGNNSPVEFDCNGVARVSYKELTCYCNPDNACGGCADKYNEAEDVTVEQFTGLLDKNGFEIFEGDIVARDTLCKYEGGGTIWRIKNFIVEFKGQEFYPERLGESEIIGNRHEHTEPLETP